MKIQGQIKIIFTVLLALSLVGGQTLLSNRFGVTLTLLPPHDGGTNNSFDWTSFQPTLNTVSTDYEESDWYGNWSWADWNVTTIQHTPAPGTGDHDDLPSGAEPYDVEAIYFDNDLENFYIAIVSSVSFGVDTDNNGVVDDVGIVEQRLNANRAFVRPGDISLNLFKSATSRLEYNNTTWCYNYGLNITDEIRPNNDNSNEDVMGAYTTMFMRSLVLGTTLYQTSSDQPASAADVIYPATGDWYTGTRSGHVGAYYEHTNFDPGHSQFTGTALGNASQVSYYNYNFAGGLLENGDSTYVLEATIPRALFGVDNPSNGGQIGIRWMPACRNDGETTTAVTYLIADVDDPDLGDAPEPTYPTLSASNGAWHYLDGTTFLGASVDADVNGQANTAADGDDTLDGNDDEDGISFTTTMTLGQQACFDVVASVNGYLNAWVDFNKVNAWSETGEQIFSDQYLAAGITNLCYTVPSDAVIGYTYLRFRFSSDNPAGSMSYTGKWNNGEVEDYRESIGYPLGIDDQPDLPTDYKLAVPYPNPFNPVTHLEYQVPERAAVSIIIYDITGRQIETLVNQVFSAGTYAIDWDADLYPGGLYLAVMQSGTILKKQKLVLLK